MRQNIGVIAVLLLGLSLSHADVIEVSRIIRDKRPIKAFVKDFANESGQAQISPSDFKKYFEDALLKRKSVRFEIVKSSNASDIQISGVIKKYLYSKTDPITTYASPTGLLLDAATTENYVEMAVEFSVVDTKSGNVIWKDTLSTFIKKMMTPEESIPLIYDKISRTFLWKCFGKPK